MLPTIQIMTDSVASIPIKLAKEYDIKVVPAAHIYYDGNEYIDGITLSAAEAYQLIKQDPDRFVTSAIKPAFLLEQYTEISKTVQKILFITLSSSLSASNKTAQLAAEHFMEKSPEINIKVVDSKTVSGAQGLIVLTVAKAAKRGLKMDELISFAEQVRQQTQGVMLLDTLRYVYRTGRMSKLGSRIASMFNIKPVNKINQEGKVEMIDRTRNTEDGLEIMVNYIKQNTRTNSLHFMISHADALDIANTFSNMLKQQFDCLSVIISEYSPVMGYGAGPGAIFVGFQPEINLPK
jgi:DegV family protein with EDD domain